MESSGDFKIKLPELRSGDGYFEWAEQMRYVLMRKGRKVWLAAQGMYVRPSDAQESGTKAHTISAQDAHMRALDEWEDANMAALALIGSCVVPHLRHLLRDEDNAHMAWNVLKLHFQEGLVQHIEQLQSALRDVCQTCGAESFDKFVAEITTLADKLAAVGVTVSALQKTTALIRGVRKDMVPWTAALQLELDKHTMAHAPGDDTKKDDGIFDRAVRVLRVTDSGLPQQSSVLAAQGQGCSSTHNRSCFNCGEVGHFKKDCKKPAQVRGAKDLSPDAIPRPGKTGWFIVSQCDIR